MRRHDYPGAPTPEERIRIRLRQIGNGILAFVLITVAVVAFATVLLCL